MPTVIMLANQKGGTGKTTSTFEVAYILSTMGKNVLMVDLDSQCNLTEICGVEKEAGKSVYDTIMGNASFEEAIQEVRPGLDILAGSRKMLSQYFVGADDIFVLKEALDLISEYKAYDFVMIDVGPEAGQLMTMAMIASDYIIAVTSLAKLGYSGVVQMCADIRSGRKHYSDFKVKPLGILMNNVKKTNVSSMNKEKYMDLAGEFEAQPFETEIKNSCVMDECKEFGQAVTEYMPGSDLALQYRKVTEEILGRIDEDGRQ